jgi:multidrug efflux pump subunit AcrB
MVKFLVHRPIAVIMSFIACFILGIASMNLIPVSLLPDVGIPEVTIRIHVPEKPANEVEQNYLLPIRRQMLQLSHLEDIESTSLNENGVIRLVFKFGTDINYAFIEVNEKMDGIMPSMPDDFDRPRIIKASATDIPVFYLTVSLREKSVDEKQERFMELSEFSEQVIKRRIEQLPEVAMVDISGVEYPEIGIYVDLEKLNTLGIDYRNIQQALEENNFSLGNIRVRNGMYEFNVKYSTLLKNRRDIEQLTIKSGDRIFSLAELSTIEVYPRSGKGIFINDKGSAIIMAVIKKSDARMKDLRKQTSDLMESLSEDYPQLKFEITRNQTKLLDYSIGNLKTSLLIGSILAFLIMLLFLKDLKSPVLIGISIPVSLIISLFFFHIFNVSINIISLSGLILGIGMMIDNSIIVIDNIAQYYQQDKKDVLKSCINGTNEVIRPLISSVLTTCAVFIPLIFLSGIAGALFYDQAIAISIGLGASLIVSITLIPVLYGLFYKTKFAKTQPQIRWLNFYQNVENYYEKAYDKIFYNRKWFLAGTLILIITGVLAFKYIRKEKFPDFEQKEAQIYIDWDRSIGVDENQKRIHIFLKQTDTVNFKFSCQIGEQSFILDRSNIMTSSEASVFIGASGAGRLNQILNNFQQWIEREFPEASYKITPPETIFEKIFGSRAAPFEVRLRTSSKEPVPPPEVLHKIAQSIVKESGYKLQNKIPLQEYYEITPCFERIKLYDVSMSQLTSILKKSLNRLPVFTLRQGQYEVPVVLTGKQEDIQTVLRHVKVHTEKKGSIPVGQLVTIQRVAGYKILKGGKEGGYASLKFDIPDNQLKNMQLIVDRVLKKYPDIQAHYTGALFINRTLFKELVVVLVVALLLLYFILASQFESVLQPLIVFIEIPIDIAGAILLLWLTGNSLNLMGMIGLVVMAGIIINDSILKIDTINRLVRDGYKVIDAIHLGGKRRLKPIIMTSATTILAMVPFLWGNDMGSRLQQPLAITIIGGMAIGTFVSLFFIPMAYYYLSRESN